MNCLLVCGEGEEAWEEMEEEEGKTAKKEEGEEGKGTDTDWDEGPKGPGSFCFDLSGLVSFSPLLPSAMHSDTAGPLHWLSLLTPMLLLQIVT